MLTGCETTTGALGPTPDTGATDGSAGLDDTISPARQPRAEPDMDKALLPEDTQDLRIAWAEVRFAPDFTRTAPHNSVTDAFILEQMRDEIPAGLIAANANGRVPVNALVEVSRFNFANVAAGLLVGTKGSLAAFRTTLYYADTGQQVGRTATNIATTPPRPTLIGVAAIKSPADEVRLVASRAAQAIAIRLFGRPE
ncbi:MAG: hypothetical protein AAFW87_13505 [Pseudomonadota bacterium]